MSATDSFRSRSTLSGRFCNRRCTDISVGQRQSCRFIKGGSLAAKAGELQITRSLRLELNGTGVRVCTIDPGLADGIAAAFAALNKVLDGYRSASDPSGYVLYPTLTDADVRALAAAVKAVQEPLSQVAAKVADG